MLYVYSLSLCGGRDIVGMVSDSLGNLEPSLNVYPDRPAPVIRNKDGGRELASLIWGMPRRHSS